MIKKFESFVKVGNQSDHLKTLLVVWLGVSLFVSCSEMVICGVSVTLMRQSEAHIHRWEAGLCPPCKVTSPL